MKLSIIIPVYNEERTLEKVIKAVEAVGLPCEKEIIFIDDNSTDRSRKILSNYANKYKVLLMDKNQGKGAVLRRGFAEATGDIVLVQDADLEYNPQDYPALISPIANGEVDVIYGSRFIKGEKTSENKIIYKRGYLFSRFLNNMSNILSGIYLSDMYTCYKVFSKSSIDKIYPLLKSNRFGFDPEVTALVAKFNFKIKEVPISYSGRTYEEGKKINWKDGVAAIFHIIRFNLFK